MNRSAIWMAIAVVGCLSCGAEPESTQSAATATEEVMPHGWLTIGVRAKVEDNGELRFVTHLDESHDLGVTGPGDQVSWVLVCDGCDRGDYSWKITNLQLVADMERLTRAAIGIFRHDEAELSQFVRMLAASGPVTIAEDTSPKEADELLSRWVRERLGIRNDHQELRLNDDRAGGREPGGEPERRTLRVGETGWIVYERGWAEWASSDQEIHARWMPGPGDPLDALWKYSIEICEGSPQELNRLEAENPGALEPERKCAYLDPHKYTHPDPPPL